MFAQGSFTAQAEVNATGLQGTVHVPQLLVPVVHVRRVRVDPDITSCAVKNGGSCASAT